MKVIILSLLSFLIIPSVAWAVEPWQTSGAHIYFQGGNVGIETSNPAYTLDVNSNAMGIGTKTANPGYGGNIRFRDDSGTARWFTGIPGSAGATSFYNVYDLTTDKVYITTTAGGRVGVGTNHTAPLQTLSVTAPSLAGIPALGLATANGQFSVLGDSAAYGLRVGVLSSGDTFFQSDRVDGTATAYNLLLQGRGGKVGIGVTSVTQTLHIAGPDASEPTLGTAPTAGVSILGGNGSYGLFIGNNGGTGATWLQSMRNDSAVAYALNLQPSGGNVGIGTTTPTQKLYVYGNAKIKNGSDLIFGDLADADGFRLGIDSGLNTAYINQVNNSSLTLKTNNAPAMTILNSGNVGVGTTTPTEKLEVNGKLKIKDAIVSDGDICIGVCD